MSVPDRIPIKHEPGYRTSTIGRYDGGQFLASISYANRERRLSLQDPSKDKVLTGALHLFDDEGQHVESEVWIQGTLADQEQTHYSEHAPVDQAEARVSALLDALPARVFGDIAIRPFQVVHEGILFGLVVHDPEDEQDTSPGATLWPDDLLFYAPWDGYYDT